MATFTLVHVVISLVAIASGFVVLLGMLAAKRLNGWTAFSLATTVATSATGFGFPFVRLLPSHVLGILSLVVLAIAIYARYARLLNGAWRRVYVITALVALYFNVFVLIVQAFLKIPTLKAMAPTQSEPPFLLAQGALLVAFIILGTLAAMRFQDEPGHTS